MKPERIGAIAMAFTELRNKLQIYHWQTENYARHKSSDELIKVLDKQVDTFIETIQGTNNTRLIIPSDDKFITFTRYQNYTDENIINVLKSFKTWLIKKIPLYLKDENTDLYNIRDEILSSINQTIYLFTFS